MLALKIKNVTKKFRKPQGDGELVAVSDISFDVEEGKIFGLLGPNGAGKSTLINMISGIFPPNSGDIEVFGTSVIGETEKVKQMLGVVPQEIVSEMAFTVEEVLHYFSGMYGVPARERKQRIDKALFDLHLEDKRNARARALSGGMKRRLMIAKAILHHPKLLILDEPTAGVDIVLRQKIWELVRSLNNDGTTIIFTTHYLEEAEQLCEEIALIDHGCVIKNGNLKNIQKEFSKNVIHFELYNRNTEHLPGVISSGTEYEIAITNLSEDMNRLTTFYQENLKSIRSEAASLEQVFLTLTQK